MGYYPFLGGFAKRFSKKGRASVAASGLFFAGWGNARLISRALRRMAAGCRPDSGEIAQRPVSYSILKMSFITGAAPVWGKYVRLKSPMRRLILCHRFFARYAILIKSQACVISPVSMTPPHGAPRGICHPLVSSEARGVDKDLMRAASGRRGGRSVLLRPRSVRQAV
ncbi:hypothetical protein BBB56_15715 [Candidatus Pantoea deserta]|uniref:Uncharacterized protein n=1 Tax=Candidatus Pantoea deserta TaxID=1869313 RepID=A0A3N4NUV8_9GAMM|nr:hypothetical protein BBB56_15715 [Pantoea deserta]